MAQVECATYTVAEAAKRLGVSRGYAYELIRRGEFPAPTRTIGTRVLVLRDGLEAFIAGGAPAPAVLPSVTHDAATG